MRRTKHKAFTIFLFFLALYILTTGRTILSGDGWAMFATAENLVRRGAIDMDQLLWTGLQQGTPGREGHLYSRKSPALSLFSVPLVWLGLKLPGASPVKTALLFNAIIASASCALLYLFCCELGYQDHEALALSLILGMATPLWPYAKTFFSEPLIGLGLLGAAYFLTRLKISKQMLYAALAGASLALVLMAKFIFVAFLPLYAWLKLRFEPNVCCRKRLLDWIAFLAPLAVAATFIVIWNWLRYGNPFNTGYLPEESFSAVWWQGILGLTISPGKGLIWYAPVFFLLPAVWPQFHSRHREISLLIITLLVGNVLLFGKWFMWHGGDCWGPRFLVPLLPLLVMPLIETSKNPRLHIPALALTLIGFTIQLPGVFVPFGLYRELLETKGIPIYATESFFNLGLSPLVLSWSLLRVENFNFIWKVGKEVDFFSLALLILAWAWTLWLLTTRAERKEWRRLLLFSCSFIALATLVVIVRVDNRDAPALLREMLDWLARQEGKEQAIINPQPEWSPYVSSIYRGHLPIYGLRDGYIDPPSETAMWLDRIMTQYEGIWLLPCPAPPEWSGIERVLMAFGYRALEKEFHSARLALYLFPKAGMKEVKANAAFEEIILEGYAFSPSPVTGNFLLVELRWYALAKPSGDYLVVLTLVDGKGKERWSKTEAPAMWTRPTTSWEPGERIIDRHGFAIAKELGPSCYSLVLRLYEPTQARYLPQGESLTLGEVCLKE